MRRIIALLATCLIALMGVASAPPAVAVSPSTHAPSWTKIYSDGGKYTYTAVSCSGSHECFVTGYLLSGKKPGSKIGRTTTNGTHWTWTTLPAVQLSALACDSSTVCFAVGKNISTDRGVLYSTTNGGVQWASTVLPLGTAELNAITCHVTCLAVGGTWGLSSEGSGVALKMSHIGTSYSWTSLSLPTGVGGLALTGVACVSSSTCFAVGQNGTFDPSTDSLWYWFLDVTHNGGATWTYNSAVSDTGFASVTCANGTDCFVLDYVVGSNLWLSTNGFTSASVNLTGGAGFSSLSCATSTECVLTGYGSSLNDATTYVGSSATGPWTAAPVLSGVNGLTSACEVRGPCFGVTGFVSGSTGSIYKIY